MRHQPSTVFISTPDVTINQSFNIAHRIINRLRETSKKYYGVDGWLSVSDGSRMPQHSYDPRDYQHICKCIAYLWSNEPGLLQDLPARLFLDQVDAGDNHVLWAHGSDQRAIHIGQTARYWSDYFRYFANRDWLSRNWDRILGITRWVYDRYDHNHDGLLEDGSQRDGSKEPLTFWGLNVGEPQNFPESESPDDEVVTASMQWCDFMKVVSSYASRNGMPEAEWLSGKYELTCRNLETNAYDGALGYYYLQYSATQQKWFHSLNGTYESSRETDICPYFAALVSENPLHRQSVAAYLRRLVDSERVFPTPLHYPTYHFEGPAHGYKGHGDTQFVCGGSWGEAYYNTVMLLDAAGMCDSVYGAVRRRSEAHVRDGDILEWYFRDGTVDQMRAHHREVYGVAATSHLCSIIEGLFGLHPFGTGFEGLNVRPNFPLSWKDADVSIQILVPLKGYFRYEWRYSSQDAAIEITTAQLPATTGRFRLRVPSAQVKGVLSDGTPIEYSTSELNSNHFVLFEHVLHGGKIVVLL